ncbi:5-formyltetrahydrofolate cyclo-ligase [Prosthecochloris sp. GSB1]|uniref:5-formyltetrahydrofolate cyclo-ligase n=1 Tax=Prosthecochloris sp. GSB1 TaxID=281093 RepID=UPI000B8CE047|nr:5-formyltetrahydrofolate cyclo-ligase [Prosthecochloris sp. GSB1]ASQ90562.1 5-formyltetrahydrofolate cyclo-ligase [Prosthecochloris sp. GSB1]
MDADPKKRLRKRMRNVREAMSVTEWESSSGMAAANAAGLPEMLGAGSVMLYLAMAERREVDTAPLVRMIGGGKERALYMPLCSGDSLCAVPFREGDPLFPGAFGQPEPVGGCVDVVPDVLVLPVVAVDARGNRLGYGKGFYDRFISGLRRKGGEPFLLALAFSFQIVDSLPKDPWDQAVDCIVTEKEVMRIR